MDTKEAAAKRGTAIGIAQVVYTRTGVSRKISIADSPNRMGGRRACSVRGKSVRYGAGEGPKSIRRCRLEYFVKRQQKCCF